MAGTDRPLRHISCRMECRSRHDSRGRRSLPLEGVSRNPTTNQPCGPAARTFFREPALATPSTAMQIPNTRSWFVQPFTRPRLLLICTRLRAGSTEETRCRYTVPATRARTMSPMSSFVGSTGATTTACRLRIRGTIEEPVGLNPTVAPPATLPATASNMPIPTWWRVDLRRSTGLAARAAAVVHTGGLVGS